MEEVLDVCDKTDEQLAAEAAREGSDGPAFTELVARHRQRVWHICHRLMDNEHDAQDAAQEVFVRLFVNRAKFEGRSLFTTWLHGLAVRTCLAMRRGRGRRRRHESTLANQTLDVLEESKESEPEALALDLKRMLSVLKEEDRAMLILKYAEGYTFEELAAIFDISVSAAKMRVSRARDRVHELYQKSS